MTMFWVWIVERWARLMWWWCGAVSKKINSGGGGRKERNNVIKHKIGKGLTVLYNLDGSWW
jgi:hypothetical protein